MDTYWECPICHKEFAKANQSHMCVVVDVKSIFEGKHEKLFGIYTHLIQRLEPLLDFKITTSTKTITLYTQNRRGFLCIQPKKAFVDLWFYLNKKMEDFPVFKITPTAKNKFAHYVRLEEMQDVDNFLLGLISEGYELEQNK
jgi:hypothetical protein